MGDVDHLATSRRAASMWAMWDHLATAAARRIVSAERLWGDRSDVVSRPTKKPLLLSASKTVFHLKT